MGFLEQFSEYIVFVLSMIIWLGIFIFQVILNRKIEKLENNSSFDTMIINKNKATTNNHGGLN